MQAGQTASRINAGVEPSNSFEIFENSISSTKKYSNNEVRFATDEAGNIHRFESTNGIFHWNGSSGDIGNLLRGYQIPYEIKKFRE